MLIKVHGVIVRTQDLSSDNRYVKIFTREKGILTATVMTRRSLRASHTAATQLFCYGEFVLYNKGDHYWVREIMLEEPFLPLRTSYERVALATYFCDVVHEVATSEGDESLLRLLLNALFAVSSGKYDLRLVKATFEFRVASIIGFMPDVTGCADCGGSEGDTFYLDVMDGHFLCAACRSIRTQMSAPVIEEADDPRVRSILALLSPAAIKALQYVIFCPLERILSFRLEEEDMLLFSRAAESYLLNHIERSFPSLEIYKKG